jgi:glycosyltransferase involved in cell wall biosynthesis
VADLVSVVIPCRNDPRLERALASVAHQSYAPVEVVVVDDASDLPILADQGRVIRRDHRVGPAAARNAGVQVAHGEWVAFLDADDWWLPSKLARQMARLEETGRDWAYTDCYYDPPPGRRMRPNSFFHRFPAMPDGRAVHEAHLAGHNFITMSSPVIRRSVCPAFQNLPVSEDWDFFTRLAWYYPPASVASALHFYTLTPNGGRHYAALDQYVGVNVGILERLYGASNLSCGQNFARARARIVERAAVQLLNAGRNQEALAWLRHDWSIPLRGTLRHWALRLAAAAGHGVYHRLLRAALWAGRV